MKHDLIKTGDPDVFPQILDRNNEVALSYCRRCRQGESTLAASCPGRVRHIAGIEVNTDSFRRGGSTRYATCMCGWVGPERATLELAVDDAMEHEKR